MEEWEEEVEGCNWEDGYKEGTVGPRQNEREREKVRERRERKWEQERK